MPPCASAGGEPGQARGIACLGWGAGVGAGGTPAALLVAGWGWPGPCPSAMRQGALLGLQLRSHCCAGLGAWLVAGGGAMPGRGEVVLGQPQPWCSLPWVAGLGVVALAMPTIAATLSSRRWAWPWWRCGGPASFSTTNPAENQQGADRRVLGRLPREGLALLGGCSIGRRATRIRGSAGPR